MHKGTQCLRVCCYTRYSTDRQRNTSVFDQLRNCERRASLDEWKISLHFSDEEMSGGTDDRPGYQRMLLAAGAREFDVLIVDDLSRSFRDNLEQERIIRRLEFAGIRIISVCDGYDSNSKARKVIRTVLGLRNEMQLDQLREQVHRGLTGLALQKRSAGGTPYGYKSVPIMNGERIDGYLKQLHPERAPIAREIFERFANGETTTSIVTDLNARGIAPPGAKWRRKSATQNPIWRKSAITAILGNEIYIGRYIWNQSRWEREPDTRVRKRIERPRSEWIVNEMPELAIVDEPTWRRTQARLKQRSHLYNPGRGGKPVYLLSGLLRCGVCGGAFIVARNRPVSYACSTRLSAGNSACSNAMRLLRDIAEERILAPIVQDMLSDEAIAIALDEMKALAKAESRANSEAPLPGAQVQKLDAELAQLERLERDGMLSGSVAGAARARALEERQRALRNVNVMNIHTDGLFGAEQAYRDEVLALRDAITGDSVSRARGALMEILGTIRLVPGEGVLMAEFGGSALSMAVGDAQPDGSGGPLCPRFTIALPVLRRRGIKSGSNQKPAIYKSGPRQL